MEDSLCGVVASFMLGSNMRRLFEGEGGERWDVFVKNLTSYNLT
jgi:hypothetical protein